MQSPAQEQPDASVLYHEEGPIAYITLNRPEKLNALNPEVFGRLEECLQRFEASAPARIAILHARGRAFAAGADIEEYVDRTLQEYKAFMRQGRAVFDHFVSCPKPIVAAVHGFVLGGGFELMLVCDLVVAADNARFGLPESKLGLLPGGGATQRLPRLLGKPRAKELIIAGRFLTAAEAQDWGLVNRVVDKGKVLESARELADKILVQASLAVRMAKRLVEEGFDAPLSVALSLEQDATAALYVSDDAREGIAAFIEKRAPRFTGS